MCAIFTAAEMETYGLYCRLPLLNGADVPIILWIVGFAIFRLTNQIDGYLQV